MRYLYVIICGLSSWVGRPVQAQELASSPLPFADSTRYEITTDTRRVNSTVDSTGTCTELLRWSEAGGLVRIFYPSGHLREYVPYGNLATGTRHGVVTTWFENGQLCTQQSYWTGRRVGELLVYYKTGALKRSTHYVDDNELPGSCFDPAGQPVAYFPYEQLPLYPGGYAQLSKEINKVLRLPRQLPQLAFLEPRLVDIEFQIAEDGSIHTPRVALSSQVPGLDQAVLTAITKLTRRFTPGRRDGRIISCAYHVPVQFKLPLPYRPVQKI